jgi:hypothetical protein
MFDDNDIVRGTAEAPSVQHLANWLGCPVWVKRDGFAMSALDPLSTR